MIRTQPFSERVFIHILTYCIHLGEYFNSSDIEREGYLMISINDYHVTKT